jgi:hypothetical protein
VEAWRSDELNAAMAFALGSAPGDGAAASSSAPLSAEAEKARKLLTATVERSRRVFGMLYAALPDELRAQVAHLPQGWAHGLWLWLETKFQSTEEDSVDDLLDQWSSLQQTEGESFDAYRARVNQLRTLLEAAKEAPSPRMYAFKLLGRLQPSYKPAVLALKVGGQLKDAEAVSWDAVVAIINAHERQERRSGADVIDGGVVAAAARTNITSGSAFQPAHSKRGGGGGGHGAGFPHGRGGRGHASNNGCDSGAGGSEQAQRGPDRRTCFRCGQKGHVAAVCTQPRPKGSAAESAKAASASKRPASTGHTANNRFDSLSSDDEQDQPSETSEWPQRACMTACVVKETSKTHHAGTVKTFAQAEAQGRAKAAEMGRAKPHASPVQQQQAPPPPPQQQQQRTPGRRSGVPARR